MVSDDQIIAAYQKHEQLFAAADEVGLPWQTIYVRLKNAGVPVRGNKSRWGSVHDKFAARGEKLFKELVPSAEDQNAYTFQPKVDFIINGYKVDVKCAKRKQSSGRYPSMRWAFSLKKQLECADFYVCLAFDEAGTTLECSYLLPRDLIIGLQTISISCSGKSKWQNFKVSPDSLSEFFKNMEAA